MFIKKYTIKINNEEFTGDLIQIAKRTNIVKGTISTRIHNYHITMQDAIDFVSINKRLNCKILFGDKIISGNMSQIKKELNLLKILLIIKPLKTNYLSSIKT